MHYSVIILAVLLSACHPLSFFFPSKLDTKKLSQKISVQLDKYGVPTIDAPTQLDAIYGLGLMHGRDRQFQIELLRHYATGRLTELFGEKALDKDREMRILAYGLREQYRDLSAKDKQILTSYAKGVNDGVRSAGRDAQMFLLRRRFADFKPIDVLAIARLQAFELACDFKAELVRMKITNEALLQPVTDGKFPLMNAAPTTAQKSLEKLAWPAPCGHPGTCSRDPSHDNRAGLDSGNKYRNNHLIREPNGSNAWIVPGKYTKSGKTILCNDPHLKHTLPSVFYLAHLRFPGGEVVGATVPGLPVVMIGHTQYLAWGLTASYADVQDVVEIKSTKDLRLWPQHFKDSSGKILHSEDFKVSSVGPILPSAYSILTGANRNFALLWIGFLVGKTNSKLFSGYFDLMTTRTVMDAQSKIQTLGLTSLNVLLADTKGNIGYGLASYLPSRASSGEWIGLQSPSETPFWLNPKQEILISANQKIAPDNTRLSKQIGIYGAPPYRAERINARIQKIVTQKDLPDLADFMAIQLDAVSVEALRLAPILGARCPKWCQSLRQFDGEFKPDSREALIYETLFTELRRVILEQYMDSETAALAEKAHVGEMAIAEEVQKAHKGISSAIIQPACDLDCLVKRAASAAHKKLTNDLGADPSKWRWGNLHRLKAATPLSVIPVIGRWFESNETEESGQRHSPRAEYGAPIDHGAAFRMCVEMGDVPRAKMIIDTGNSGHPGHPNFEDQKPLWSKGEAIEIPLLRSGRGG